MDSRRPFNLRTPLGRVVLPALIIFFPLGYSVISDALGQGNPRHQLFLERPDPKYDRCVKDTTYMRFHHMDLLKSIREAVVREGQRDKIGLTSGAESCRTCHTGRERFCNQCHNVANVRLDCFGCHDYPEAPQVASGETPLLMTQRRNPH